MMSAAENIIMREQGQQMTCVWAWEVTAPMSPARNKDREVGGDAHMVRFGICKFGTCAPVVHSGCFPANYQHQRERRNITPSGSGV